MWKRNQAIILCFFLNWRFLNHRFQILDPPSPNSGVSYANFPFWNRISWLGEFTIRSDHNFMKYFTNFQIFRNSTKRNKIKKITNKKGKGLSVFHLDLKEFMSRFWRHPEILDGYNFSFKIHSTYGLCFHFLVVLTF